jgi:hypothetical protein
MLQPLPTLTRTYAAYGQTCTALRRQSGLDPISVRFCLPDSLTIVNAKFPAKGSPGSRPSRLR